jgi:quinohemoprotein ethanol dehydrogenase
VLYGAGILLATVGCNGTTYDRKSAIDPEGGNWASVGRSYDEQGFSPLQDINEQTVPQLGLAWSLDLDDEHTLEGTPLAIDGTLYFTGQMAKIYAVDAVSGKLLWAYDPKAYEVRPKIFHKIFPANRGLAYWNGLLFVGTLDGRLIAIDAKTGKQRWSVMTLDPNSSSFITGAPRAFNGKIIIGNGGADYNERGFVTTYDAMTGKQLWRFYTAPGDPATDGGDAAMRLAEKTWRGQYWKTGTGGSVWNGITYDPQLNRIYLGTGNSGPYDPEVRSPGGGDNLFLASIVALDADTGKYIWHYQVNPREAWDYKATANMILATLKIDGRDRHVIMQSPTNGFFYVIDRDTGKLISAEKTGKVTWASRIDLKTGRPVEAENIRYQSGPVTIWPSGYGAHSWQAMSYSPDTGLVYIPYMQLGARYAKSSNGIFGNPTTISLVVKDKDDGTGALLAWDPVAQKARWKIRRSKMWNGGVLSTAGDLVFQGDADGNFEARSAKTGALLWYFNAGLGIVGAPIAFRAKGDEYVSILVGFGGGTALQSSFLKSGWKYGLQPRRLLTFKLGGQAKLPDTPPPDYSISSLDKPGLMIDAATAERGANLYAANGCVLCHGADASSPGVPAPDLRESGIALEEDSFRQFITSGARASVGMPNFSNLSPQDIHSIYIYIRQAARAAKEETPAVKPAAAGHF